ncbi:TlpA disulfide reductase family protein [Desertivirga arenae]|uniref:TlpA disulfide reductase family protein n=1 Tax=Desertivirga arenae TaxID=2810309 RepID=UPI001A97077C|nr:TlpA disulfide reductase family protein [Pedobacter sp. SYSU D00823]
MKNKLFITLLSAIPAIGMAQTGPFTLSGKVGNLNSPAKVYLDYMSEGKSMSDSAILKNGVFTFQGKVTGPSYSRIIIAHKGEPKQQVAYGGDLMLFYMGAEKMTLSSKDSLKYATVKGSKINDEYQAFIKRIGGTMQELTANANAEFSRLSPEQQKDTAFFNVVDRNFRQAIRQRETKMIQFAKENPNSFFSVVALSEAAGSKVDLPVFEPIFLALNPTLRNSDAGKEFAVRINAAKITVNGATAPDFTQNDVNDKPVKLSDFRGKYVLIDFWASWCGPCRAENPNLKEAYNKYKDKNFTVLGVSLDQPGKKAAWLAAIEKDGLTWTNVSDLNYWNNQAAKLYGVRAVPQNFLVDPNGKIVAQNLRGKELFTKLESLLGN